MAAPKDKRVFSELSHHKGLSDEVRNSMTLDVENAILMLKSYLTWGCFQKGRAESSQSLHR